MSTIRRMVLFCAVSAFTVGVLTALPQSATACPSCKAANETDSLRPRAYMYSILFMLAMPATVFAGFGICFYRMSRSEAELSEMYEMSETSLPEQRPDVEPDDFGLRQSSHVPG